MCGIINLKVLKRHSNFDSSKGRLEKNLIPTMLYCRSKLEEEKHGSFRKVLSASLPLVFKTFDNFFCAFA